MPKPPTSCRAVRGKAAIAKSSTHLRRRRSSSKTGDSITTPCGPSVGVAKRLAQYLPWFTDVAAKQIWQKAAFNCAVNATALPGKATVGFLAQELGKDMAMRIAAEVLALAESEDIQTDVERGARTEIDALNGYVARRSRERSIEAPFNDLITRLVRMQEKQ